MINFTERLAKSGKNEYTIFLLHGFGDSGESFINFSEYFSDISENIHFIAPNAPQQIGPGSYQWFPLDVDNITMTSIAVAIEENYRVLRDFIDEHIRKSTVKSENVFIIGFSQGAMMSLYAGLRLSYRIGGIVSFSGLYPESISNSGPTVKVPQNVLMIHSEGDEVVPYASLVHSRKLLENLGIKVRTYTCHNATRHLAIDYDCVRTSNYFIRDILGLQL
jgi:phospholipase/carboxylesterase